MTKYLLIAVIALSVAVALAAINQIRTNFTIRELERQQDKKGIQAMKRVVHYKTSRKTVINIMASGLTRDEIGQIKELIRSMARKRSHGKRPQLLYDLVFND